MSQSTRDESGGLYVEHETTTSPLLRLPVEIRLAILELVLCNQHINIRRKVRQVHDQLDFTHAVLPWDSSPPEETDSIQRAFGRQEAMVEVKLPILWRVCKQLHAETIDLLVNNSNIFSFADVGVLSEFSDRFRPMIKDITRIWTRRLVDPDDTWRGASTFIPFGSLQEVWVTSRIQKLERIVGGLDGYDAGSRYFACNLLTAERLKISKCQKEWEELGIRFVVKEDLI